MIKIQTPSTKQALATAQDNDINAMALSIKELTKHVKTLATNMGVLAEKTGLIADALHDEGDSLTLMVRYAAIELERGRCILANHLLKAEVSSND